jgi:mRNA-degrading endonuclease RelE of RelBE toxin-antitoxin system
VQLLYFHEFIEALHRIDKEVQKQIKGKLREFYRTPFEQHAPLALKGAQFKGLYKLRVGDWPLIYKIERTELLFIGLAHPLLIHLHAPSFPTSKTSDGSSKPDRYIFAR